MPRAWTLSRAEETARATLSAHRPYAASSSRVRSAFPSGLRWAKQLLSVVPSTNSSTRNSFSPSLR